VAQQKEAKRRVRAQVGQALARLPAIQLLPAARTPVIEGDVDDRVMTILAALATQQRFRVLDFAPSPKPVPGGPQFTIADIVTSPAPNDRLKTVVFLQSRPQPLRPYRVNVLPKVAGGRDLVRLTYRAP
jgi:hypothetical protein